MSLAFLSHRSTELPDRAPEMWGFQHRRSLSGTFAEAPVGCPLPVDDPGASGGMFSGAKAPGALPPPPDARLIGHAGRHRAHGQPAGAPYPGIFARSSAVLQNMLPVFPKGLAVMAKGGARGLGSDWLVGAGPGGDGGRDGRVGEGGEDAESVALGGAKQHSLYKTELCRSWEETGTCRYGSKCQFAHGAAELRDVPRHPKYKTEICCTFATTGTCPYGRRCRFIHQNGPFAAVGTKPTSEEPHAKPALPSSLGAHWPVRQQVTQEPTAPASRRLPVFVKLSTTNPTSLVMT